MKWLIVIAIVVIAGAGGFMAFNSFSGDEDSERISSSNETEDAADTAEETSTERSTLNKLLARGESMKCTYSYTDDDGNSSTGLAYFADGKMSGEFSVTQTDGTTHQSSVLNVDDTQYFWDETTKQGYKMDVSAVSDASDDTTSQGPDQDAEYEFDCEDWNVEQSKFEVPSDVQFTDTTELMQGVQENLNQAAAACAELDGQAKLACEQAVGAQ